MNTMLRGSYVRYVSKQLSKGNSPHREAMRWVEVFLIRTNTTYDKYDSAHAHASRQSNIAKVASVTKENGESITASM